MTILQIPTTAFSRCILETENEHLPPTDAQIPTLLRVAQSSQLFIHLGGRRNAERLNQKRLKEELNNVVHVSLHDHLADATRRNVWQTGFYLNELHRERLNETVWWECRGLPRRSEQCKLQAKQVIEAFCGHFCIELDVDINYDTLYKSWTRYRQTRESTAMNDRRAKILGEKKNRFLQKNTPRVVPDFYRKTRQSVRGTSLFSDADLETIAENYAATHPSVFLTKEKKPRTIRTKQLRCYIFHQIGKRRLREIKTSLGIAEKTAHAAIVAFMQVLQSAPPIDLNFSSPYNNVEK